MPGFCIKKQGRGFLERNSRGRLEDIFPNLDFFCQNSPQITGSHCPIGLPTAFVIFAAFCRKRDVPRDLLWLSLDCSTSLCNSSLLALPSCTILQIHSCQLGIRKGDLQTLIGTRNVNLRTSNVNAKVNFY